MRSTRLSNENPFSTRYLRPDAREYLFPDGGDVEALVARLREFAWWGQITGGHGCGKSTLVQTLLPGLRAAGRAIEFRAFRRRAAFEPKRPWFDGWPRVPSIAWTRQTQMVIDGYEQLGWWTRIRLKRLCRQRGAGLLVTAHGDYGLPQLWHAPSSLELTRRIAQRLLGGRDAAWLAGVPLDALFELHRGNVREVLFELYDLYEAGR